MSLRVGAILRVSIMFLNFFRLTTVILSCLRYIRLIFALSDYHLPCRLKRLFDTLLYVASEPTPDRVTRTFTSQDLLLSERQ